MKVHLSGVCGTAMASLAGVLIARGDQVTGSDQDVYPPMSTQLDELGVPILTPYAEANVSPEADLVVIGNALSRGNPEVEAVLDRRQPMTSMPAFLGEQFISRRRSLVVAGTHGEPRQVLVPLGAGGDQAVEVVASEVVLPPSALRAVAAQAPVNLPAPALDGRARDAQPLGRHRYRETSDSPESVDRQPGQWSPEPPALRSCPL